MRFVLQIAFSARLVPEKTRNLCRIAASLLARAMRDPPIYTLLQSFCSNTGYPLLFQNTVNLNILSERKTTTPHNFSSMLALITVLNKLWEGLFSSHD